MRPEWDPAGWGGPQACESVPQRLLGIQRTLGAAGLCCAVDAGVGPCPPGFPKRETLAEPASGNPACDASCGHHMQQARLLRPAGIGRRHVSPSRSGCTGSYGLWARRGCAVDVGEFTRIHFPTPETSPKPVPPLLKIFGRGPPLAPARAPRARAASRGHPRASTGPRNAAGCHRAERSIP